MLNRHMRLIEQVSGTFILIVGVMVPTWLSWRKTVALMRDSPSAASRTKPLTEPVRAAWERASAGDKARMQTLRYALCASLLMDFLLHVPRGPEPVASGVVHFPSDESGTWSRGARIPEPPVLHRLIMY